MPTWSSATDWDNGTGTRFAHEQVTGTDHEDASVLTAGYSYTNPPSSVTHWYPLHEDGGQTAYDVVGSSNGTYNGSSQFTGIAGASARAFDGTSQYVDTSVNPNTALSSPCSILFWLYARTPDDGDRDAIIDVYNGNKQIWCNVTGAGNLVWASWDGSPIGIDSGGPSISANTWHSAVLTHGSSGYTIYVDGGNVVSDPSTTLHTPNTSNMPIGAGYNAGSIYRYFDGALAEVHTRNKELTQTEAQAFHDAGVSNTYTTSWKPW